MKGRPNLRAILVSRRVFLEPKSTSAVTPLGRSRPAADAAREVTERWLLDGVDVSVGHRRCSRDPSQKNDPGGRSAHCPFCPSPIGTPETVPVNSPVLAKKTGLFKASAKTGTFVSVNVRMPPDASLKRPVPPVI